MNYIVWVIRIFDVGIKIYDYFVEYFVVFEEWCGSKEVGKWIFINIFCELFWFFFGGGV